LNTIKTIFGIAATALSFALLTSSVHAQPSAAAPIVDATTVIHQRMKIGNVDLFYREAGDPLAPTILLLHGFPTSSVMFRNLIPVLAQKYRVLAPDLPGFGLTKAPPRGQYNYTFENLATVVDQFIAAKGVKSYAMYVMDYGAPVGWRLALAHPEQVNALVIQNGNAYDEGLREFWAPVKTYWQDGTDVSRQKLAQFLVLAATNWQYTHGQPNQALISPDAAIVDQYFLDQGENKEMQLDLFYDYRNNVALYPKVQEYFRKSQPPTLVVWGRNDHIFPYQGAEAYRKDLKTLDISYMDGGHFILESHGRQVARKVMEFLDRTARH
jgi:pimeloyl-ACP methyl ester carboxylesterase